MLHARPLRSFPTRHATSGSALSAAAAAILAAAPTLAGASGGCGDPEAGSCFWAHPGVGCDNATCCTAVCAVDPTCCSVGWDIDCAEAAAQECAVVTLSNVIVNPTTGRRHRLVSPTGWQDFVAFAQTTVVGDVVGCPLSIGSGVENQWVRCFLASNVPGIGGPSELFFSEYYEGNGADNHAIEVYNPTALPVQLDVGGYTIQIFNAGSPTPTTTHALIGTIPAGGTWVVAPAAANDAIQSRTDQAIATDFNFNGDDAIVLVKGADGAIVDVIGQIGVDPGSQWGSGSSSTADNGLRRKVAICAGDPDGSDAFDPSVEWEGVLVGDVSNLGVHATECANDFSVWTGLNDTAVEGTFAWFCGDEVSYTNWEPGEPNNGGNSDYTELLGSTGRWRDRGNAAIEFGVVEYGYSQCGSGGGCFTAHANPGCNNESCCQAICFTDGFCCDNSWDAICVSEAQSLCSPPVLAGPIVNPSTGHAYYLLDTCAWPEGQEKALSLNGNLATIDDAAENAWVLANVLQFDGDARRGFIGLNDQAREGAFQWVDGSPVAYTNWGANEPGGPGGGNNFTEMRDDGTWRDNTLYGPTDFSTFAIVEAPCFADLDGSGGVDGADLGLLLGSFNTTEKAPDLNLDGIVDGADLGLMLGAWGPCS